MKASFGAIVLLVGFSTAAALVRRTSPAEVNYQMYFVSHLLNNVVPASPNTMRGDRKLPPFTHTLCKLSKTN